MTTSNLEGMGRSDLLAEIESRRLDSERLDFLGGDWRALENVLRRGLVSDRSIRSLVDEERDFAAEVSVRVDPRASVPEIETADTLDMTPRRALPPPPVGDTMAPPPSAPEATSEDESEKTEAGEEAATVLTMPEHVIDALAWVLLRIGGWTHSTFSTHVRHEFGDGVGDELEEWLDEAGVLQAIRGIAVTPANESVSAWRVLADPRRRESAMRQEAAKRRPSEPEIHHLPVHRRDCAVFHQDPHETLAPDLQCDCGASEPADLKP